MDRHEFYRITHQTDHGAEAGNGLEGDSVGLRLGAFQNGILTFPPGSLLVTPAALQSKGNFRYHARRGTHPVCLQAASVDHSGTTTRERDPRRYAEEMKQKALASLVHALRPREDRNRSERRHSDTDNFNAGRVASFNGRYTPYSGAYVGVIAPSLVGRPIMQFRGTHGNGGTAGRMPTGKFQESQIVDLVEDEDTFSESQSRSQEGTCSRAIHHPADGNIVSRSQSSGTNVWLSQVPEVCFTSNGMMQMEMYNTRGSHKASTQTGYGEDEINPLDLDSLRIAQHIGSPGMAFTQQRSMPRSPQRHIYVAPCDVLNLISDEEDAREGCQQKTGDLSSAVEAEREGLKDNQDGLSEKRVLECMQPLLNAIEIVSAQDNEITTDDALAGLAVEGFPDESLDEQRLTNGRRKKLSSFGAMRPRSNAMTRLTQELYTTGRRKRPDNEKGKATELHLESCRQGRQASSRLETESLKAKRTRVKDPNDVEDNPYRKTYSRRYHRSKHPTQESHRFMNGPTTEDNKEIALWNFLNHGIQVSQSTSEEYYPQPVEDLEDLQPFELPSILSSDAPSSDAAKAPLRDAVAWSQVKSFLEELSYGQQQMLVQQQGICGLADTLLIEHVSSAN